MRAGARLSTLQCCRVICKRGVLCARLAQYFAAAPGQGFGARSTSLARSASTNIIGSLDLCHRTTLVVVDFLSTRVQTG